MRQTLIMFGAVYALVIGTASCNSSSNGPAPTLPTSPTTPGTYVQIERLARPAVKELFQAFANHDGTNRSSPAATPTGQTLYQEIGSFTTNVAGRDAAHAATLQAILIPDEVSADLSQPGTGSYLGVETGGATAADKDKFGGRTLADDVIDISLGAVFGSTLSDLGLIPDDGKEVPCLTTDNVSQKNAADNVTTTFPYVGTAH